MTVQQIYDLALSLMFEKGYDTADYDTVVIPMSNLLLAEAFPIEQSIRKATGKNQLDKIPVVKLLTDTFEYDDRLVRVAFPYGLAAKLIYDDNDMGKVGYFQSQFVSFANECCKAIPSDIEDLYR